MKYNKFEFPALNNGWVLRHLGRGCHAACAKVSSGSLESDRKLALAADNGTKEKSLTPIVNFRQKFFSSNWIDYHKVYTKKKILKSTPMSPSGAIRPILSSILKKLSLGQLNIEHQEAQTETKQNSLPRTRSQQENSTNPEDGHVWKDEWRTRGYSRWPLTNSQFGKGPFQKKILVTKFAFNTRGRVLFLIFITSSIFST